MQPQTKIKFNSSTFDKIKTQIKNIARAERNQITNPAFATDLPLEIGFELTRKCNLRCKHCFLWSDTGLYSEKNAEETNNTEIDPEILFSVLAETKEQKSNLFFWGAEPLLYSYWNELTDWLADDKRWTVLCTNGTLIDKKIDSIIKISEKLATVISVDGFENEHDHIRGTGCFQKTISNINLLLNLKVKGLYKGDITVHCVINDHNVGYLYDFCRYFEDLGVDNLYIGYPWYINKHSADQMDHFYYSKLSFLSSVDKLKTKSWHTYIHNLSADYSSILENQTRQINQREWTMRFRFQPAVEIGEIGCFLAGNEFTAQNKKRCLAICNRLDVRADSTVTTCQCFPELTAGDLKTDNLKTIWHNDKFTKFRQIISKELMPVCSKCILLYLNGR